ncbi:DUF1129 domain-containing protein [Bacillus sp. TL12]|uniref:DUF1129 domain-containing protein n=1 Tax=Bacillus sp. TL12 TaxID=2894756 RepID=UPI001F51886E|nr:DUF1129 domain-containing protein [Bacillus sp. TL12]
MLSTEARNFLLDMRMFLTAKGVKESDVESFLEDAKLHLIEGEMDGKSVADIFGSSPKEYANELVKVMEKDRRESWKQIGYTVMNIVAFWIIASILVVNDSGQLQISVVQCIGYGMSLMIALVVPNLAFREMAFRLHFSKQLFVQVLLMAVPMVLLGAVIILDIIYPTPMIELTQLQSYMIAGAIFIVTVIINVYFEGWYKVLYLVVPLAIMLVFKTFTSEDLMPMLFQIVCLYGSLFILIIIEFIRKANKREAAR